MYTIIMNSDKSLTTTVKTTLYQREKLVDKIQFLFPQKYEDLDLSDFTVLLKYVDQGNEPHVEELVKDDELYKDRLRFVLPIDTDLTRFSGDITIRITLSKVDMEEQKQYLLHTGEAVITISPMKDYFGFVSDSCLEVIDRKMAELDVKMEALDKMSETYSEEKADNIVLDEETNELYLESNGKAIGQKISLNDLGDSLVENTEDGMIKVIL